MTLPHWRGFLSLETKAADAGRPTPAQYIYNTLQYNAFIIS